MILYRDHLILVAELKNGIEFRKIRDTRRFILHMFNLVMS